LSTFRANPIIVHVGHYGQPTVTREALRGEEIVDMMWVERIRMGDVGRDLYKVQMVVGFV
jgi:hypothetical protein